MSSSAACHLKWKLYLSLIRHMDAHSSTSSEKWLEFLQCSKWDVSLLLTVTRALSQQFRGCYRVKVHLLPPTSSVSFGIATVVPHHNAPTRPHGQRMESAPPPSVTVERVQTCNKACRIIRFNTECSRVSNEFIEFAWTTPFNSNDHDIKFEPTGVFDGYYVPRYN